MLYQPFVVKNKGPQVGALMAHFNEYVTINDGKAEWKAEYADMSDTDLWLFGKDAQDLAHKEYAQCIKNMTDEAYWLLRIGADAYRVIEEMNKQAARFGYALTPAVIKNVRTIAAIVQLYTTTHLNRGW